MMNPLSRRWAKALKCIHVSELLDVNLLVMCIFNKKYELFFNFQDKFSAVDIRVRVNGGGHVSQIYAIRQAISKALVAYYQKCK